MHLASIAPYPDGAEKRTFECSKCEFIETKIASDPLKSDAIVRMASNIRPPV
jgi:hypothetical protein